MSASAVASPPRWRSLAASVLAAVVLAGAVWAGSARAGADPPVSASSEEPLPDNGTDPGDPEPPATSWEVAPSSGAGTGGRPYVVHDLPPGGAVTDSLRITNYSAQPIELSLYSTDAYIDPDSGLFDLLLGTAEVVGAGAWITLDTDVSEAGASDADTSEPSTLEVPARSSVEVPFAIAVPADATPGDHAAGIVTSMLTEGVDSDGQQVRFEVRIAARVYLFVHGEPIGALMIEDLSVGRAGPLLPTGRDVTLSYTVRNAGNVRLGAETRAVVSGPLGRELGSATGAPVAELLPGSSVRQQIVVPGVIAAGRLTGTVSVQPVDTQGRLDGPLDPVTARVRGWAIPWLPVFALVLLLGWLRRRRGAALTETDESDDSPPGTGDRDEEVAAGEEAHGGDAAGGEVGDGLTRPSSGP